MLIHLVRVNDQRGLASCGHLQRACKISTFPCGRKWQVTWCFNVEWPCHSRRCIYRLRPVCKGVTKRGFLSEKSLEEGMNSFIPGPLKGFAKVIREFGWNLCRKHARYKSLKIVNMLVNFRYKSLKIVNMLVNFRCWNRFSLQSSNRIEIKTKNTSVNAYTFPATRSV